MDLTEEEIYEGMGLENPADPTQGNGSPTAQEPPEGEPTGATGQEDPTGAPSGDPAAGQGGGSPGAQEPPEGDPAGAPGQEDPTGAPGGDPAAGQGGGSPAEQEELQRVRGVANQEAIDRAYAEAFAGKTNPFTGLPIRSQADYQAYITRYEEEQRKNRLAELQKAGITPEAIEAIVSEHPTVKAAQIAIEQAEREKQAAVAAEGRRWYESQIAGINALDPEDKVKDLNDLQSRDPEGFKGMLEKVSRGMSLVEAYKLSHFDELMGRRTSAAKQAALNRAAGKEHLQAIGGQAGAGQSVEVPADVRAMYLSMDPDMTEEEIRKDYQKRMKM